MKDNVYSNDLLLECKELIRKCVSNSCLKVNCDEILTCVHEPIDTDKFESWLSFNLETFKSKTNQSSYFKKSFVNELNKGTFTISKVEYIPNTQELINQMREKIVLLADDTAYLTVLWDYMLNDKKIELSTCKKLNQQVIVYMTGTFEDYKSLLKRSNTLKPYNVDWELIDKRTAEYINSWNQTLDELESAYD